MASQKFVEYFHFVDLQNNRANLFLLPLHLELIKQKDFIKITLENITDINHTFPSNEPLATTERLNIGRRLAFILLSAQFNVSDSVMMLVFIVLHDMKHFHILGIFRIAMCLLSHIYTTRHTI